MIEQELKTVWPAVCGPLNWQYSPDGMNVYSTGHIISSIQDEKDTSDRYRIQINVYSRDYILPTVRAAIKSCLDNINGLYRIVQSDYNSEKREHEFIVDITILK